MQEILRTMNTVSEAIITVGFIAFIICVTSKKIRNKILDEIQKGLGTGKYFMKEYSDRQK